MGERRPYTASFSCVICVVWIVAMKKGRHIVLVCGGQCSNLTKTNRSMFFRDVLN